jgi:lipoxygenase homology domain-containing protein 1
MLGSRISGDIKKIRIEHDNGGFRPGWLLDRVEITNTTTNRKWTFPCNTWLDKGKGDGQIARELLPRN